MAIEKVIKISADTEDAVKNIDNVTEAVENVGDSAVDTSEKITDIKKASKGASLGIKAIGTAFKAIGIGIVVALFAKLAEIIGKNQKVMDVMSNVMTTLEIAFKDLYNFVSDNFMPAFENMKQFFQNLTFDRIKKAIQENLIERFNSLLEVLGFVGTAFKKLFEGDFKGALDSVKAAGVEVFDVMTGVDNTLGKVTDSVNNGIKAITEYTKKTYEQAKAITELNNQAEISAAINRGLIEQYDRQAERLRQIRDDESKSIEERIEANERLGEVLNEQEIAMLKNADLVIAAAANNNALNKTTETQVALIEAQNEKAAIQAQIEGFRSEQLVNTNGLLKERNELEQEYYEFLREAEEGEFENEEERLKTIFDIRQKYKDLEEQSELDKINEEERRALDELTKLEASEFDKQKIRDFFNAKREQNAEIVNDAEVNMASNTLGKIGQLAEKNSALGKATSAAAALINTYQGITAELATKTATPFEFGLKIANIASTAAIGFKAVKDILKTKPSSSQSAPSVSGSSGSGTSAPSFNLVQGSGSNQIAESLSNQDQPLQAYVVSGDVSSAQSLDRNIVENSGL